MGFEIGEELGNAKSSFGDRVGFRDFPELFFDCFLSN
jgi:hypothetical protein